ncbi:MAG: SWIM zinc finger family protein [Elusimicrobia bacterium]|nr:SWIM zinc finger family protein [Elusimicrobiota bacterium]
MNTETKIDSTYVAKNLSSWASAAVVARGRAYQEEGRVLSVDWDDKHQLTAEVQGSQADPYDLTVTFDDVGWPQSECECPFDWEPLCKHAVAALLEWSKEDRDEPSDAAEMKPKAPSPNAYLLDVERVERAARQSSAKSQDLRIDRRPAQSLLGEYRVGSSAKGQTYTVTVRDARWENASCTCPDYRVNELHLCKHIERVREKLSTRSALARLEQEAAALRHISLYVAPRPSHEGPFHPAEDIRLHVPPALADRTGDHQTGFVPNGRPPKEQMKAIAHMVRRLKRIAPVRVDGEVNALLKREVESAEWEKRIDVIARHPETHPVWKKSAGALRLELHPYQVQGILFAARKRRAFLGDDMGLGKTVQGIGTALFLKELGVVKRAMVICPASLKYQWKREIERLCGESVCLIEGSARERARLYRESSAFFWVINYELVVHDLSVLADAADLVVLDEAQRIKNWQTRTAKTVKSLRAPFRLVLTGTPMENRLTELHSLSEFLDSRALGPAWKLIPTYARLDENLKIGGYQNLDHLRGRLSRFFLRRSRPEVMAQLPPRTDNTFWTPILPDQRKVHQELENGVAQIIAKWKRFKHLTPEDFRRLMLLLNTMRIVCNAHGQFNWVEIEHEVVREPRVTPALWKKIGSPKLQEFPKVLSDLLETAGQKVLVFSQWERMLRLAEFVARDVTAEKGIQSVFFHGGLSQKERRVGIQRFLDDPDTRVFFSTDAGSVGLNLQSAANCVINLEIPWNPAVLEQRIGRVHRQGQSKSVEVVHFISEACVEERIFQLVGQKKALFAGLFDGAKDIDFTAVQKASFLEKVQSLMGREAKASATSSEPVPPLALPVDAGSDKVTPPVTAPAADPGASFDLNPLVQTVAALFRVPGDRVPKLDPVRVQRTPEGTTVHLPASLEGLMRNLRPLAESLLKGLTDPSPQK